MNEFTLLRLEQLYGPNKLEVLKKRGIIATSTDFSVFLGLEDLFNNYDKTKKKKFESRKGEYLTSDLTENGEFISIDNLGGLGPNHNFYIPYGTGVRPALKILSIDNIPTNDGIIKRADDGVIEVEYGFYPQHQIYPPLHNKLEKLYKKRKLRFLKKIEGTFKINYPYFDVYEYKKEKYVRVVLHNAKIRSNDGSFKDEDVEIWMKVEPVKWIVDENENIMISEKILFSGIEYLCDDYFNNGDFENSNMSKFLNSTFKMDLCQYITTPKIESENIKSESIEPKNIVVKDRVLKLVIETKDNVEKLNIDCENKKKAIEKLEYLSQEYFDKMKEFKNNCILSNLTLTLESEYTIQYEYIKKIIDIESEFKSLETNIAEMDELENQLNKVKEIIKR